MPAASYDLTIEQGATFTLPITLKNPDGSPLVITGYTFRGQIRKTHKSSVVAAEFTITITDDDAGKISVDLTEEQTAAITCGETADAAASIYVYDIEMVDISNKVTRILDGKAIISPEVTRPVPVVP